MTIYFVHKPKLDFYDDSFHAARSKILPPLELQWALNRLKREFPKGTLIGEEKVKWDDHKDYKYGFDFPFCKLDRFSELMKRTELVDYCPYLTYEHPTQDLIFHNVSSLNSISQKLFIQIIGKLKFQNAVIDNSEFHIGISKNWNQENANYDWSIDLNNVPAQQRVEFISQLLEITGLKDDYEMRYDAEYIAFRDAGFQEENRQKYLLVPKKSNQGVHVVDLKVIQPHEQIKSDLEFGPYDDFQTLWHYFQKVSVHFISEFLWNRISVDCNVPLDPKLQQELNAFSDNWSVDFTCEFKNRKAILEIPKGATPENPIRYPRFFHSTKTRQIQVNMIHTGAGSFLEFYTHKGLKVLKKYLAVAEIDPIFWEGPPQLRWDGEGTCKNLS